MMAHSQLLPPIVKDKQDLFESFITLCHFVNMTMLATLSDILSLKDNASFQAYHPYDKPSKTTLVLLHYPIQGSQYGMDKHTDIGTLTLLFIEQWGLQLQQHPGSDEWEFVAPLAGHALVNVGDSLRFLSENKFNSCLHRVVPVSSNEDRYTIAYFLRPENETRFKDMYGREVKAVDWHDDKFGMFAEPHDRQERSMLTGGMERNAS